MFSPHSTTVVVLEVLFVLVLVYIKEHWGWYFCAVETISNKIYRADYQSSSDLIDVVENLSSGARKQDLHQETFYPTRESPLSLHTSI